MGPATLALIGMIAGSGMQLTGNFMTMKSANAEAEALRGQGDLAMMDAAMQAAQIQENARRLQATQAMKYTMSGVSVVGTPLHAIDETARKSQQEIAALLMRGFSMQDLYEGKASNLEGAGRGKMLGGIGSTALKMFQLYNMANGAGMFGNVDASGLEGVMVDSNAFDMSRLVA